jgi:hypothetical protein
MTSKQCASEQEAESLLVGPESLAWRLGSDARLYPTVP